MEMSDESSFSNAMIDFARSVDTHMVAAIADIRQINLILDEAVSKLHNSFFLINDSLDANRDKLNDLVLDTLTPSLNSAVTALQFHDLTTQLSSRLVNRLDGMSEILECTQYLGSDKSETNVEVLTILKARVLEHNDNLHKKFNQSLNQQHMECGDVELF
jgi:hypothetical protein